MLAVIVFAFFGYLIYVRAIRPGVIRRKYTEEPLKVETMQPIDAITLHNELVQRNFTFPELKNIRINQHGQVVIEG